MGTNRHSLHRHYHVPDRYASRILPVLDGHYDLYVLTDGRATPRDLTQMLQAFNRPFDHFLLVSCGALLVPHNALLCTRRLWKDQGNGLGHVSHASLCHDIRSLYSLIGHLEA